MSNIGTLQTVMADLKDLNEALSGKSETLRLVVELPSGDRYHVESISTEMVYENYKSKRPKSSKYDTQKCCQEVVIKVSDTLR